MSADTVTKASEEVKKIEERLKKAKEKERKAKQAARKKQKAKRDAWLVLFAEVLLAKQQWPAEKVESLIKDAEDLLPAAKFNKLVAGLEDEGLLRRDAE